MLGTCNINEQTYVFSPLPYECAKSFIQIVQKKEMYFQNFSNQFIVHSETPHTLFCVTLCLKLCSILRKCILQISPWYFQSLTTSLRDDPVYIRDSSNRKIQIYCLNITSQKSIMWGDEDEFSDPGRSKETFEDYLKSQMPWQNDNAMYLYS